jgi:hypothetical protein
MKKVIRLTESDLVRIVKRVIKEGEEHEKKFNELSNSGENPLIAYYKSQLDDNTTIYDLFNTYGKSLAIDLFDNDPYIFLNVMFDKRKNQFNKDFDFHKIEDVLTYYFCDEGEAEAEFILDNWAYYMDTGINVTDRYWLGDKEE